MLRSATSLSCLVVCVVAIAAVQAGVTADAAPAVENCGTLSMGPADEVRGSTTGALCLLHAYQRHCRPAVYVLSLLGVDTTANDRFRVVSRSGRCRVALTISFRIVPQPARVQSGVCARLALRSGHVVAGRCTGSNIPASIVLNPSPQSP